VGKTTTAINLSAAVANKGFKTLLIDLDPQANSTMSYVDSRAITRSMYDVLVSEELELPDVVVPTPVENLSVAPSKIALAKLESKLIGDLDGPFRLKDRMKDVASDYDYVFIDTPPTLGMITVNALVASTHVLVPIQSSYFALEGTDDLLETIEKIKARPNPNLQLLGVVITMHDKRTTLAKDIHDQIGQVFGDRLFNTVITKSIRLEESPAYRESIFTFAPKSSGAMEYYSLSEELLSRV
jgi:chromosome partitioning protein